MSGTDGEYPLVLQGFLAVLLIFASPVLGDVEGEQNQKAVSSGHGERAKPYDPREFTPQQRERIDRLFYRVMCKCKKENWSKTLAGCPDACADEQKQEIRVAVKAGRSDQEILDEQARKYGPRALAIPDSTLASWFPYMVLGGLTVVVLLILARSIRPAPRTGPEGESQGPASPSGLSEEDRRIADAVERDLEEMDR